jgi:hypothetical protein
MSSRTSIAHVETLESRLLMVHHGFPGVFYGPANVTGVGAVTMMADVQLFDQRHKTMQVDLTYGSVAEPFSGSFKKKSGAYVFSSTNGSDSLTFNAKLLRGGKQLRITFTENFHGQQFQGNNISLPWVP